MIDIKKEAWWTIKKFGKLRIKDPSDLNPKSKKKHVFLCECGKSKPVAVYDVTSGKTVSCGRCNEMSSEWWSKQKFGRLILKSPRTLNKNSKKKTAWICVCGNESFQSIYSVTNGKARSCGRCTVSINSWYEKNRDSLNLLKAPIFPDNMPSGGPKILEKVTRLSKPFKALCPHCETEYYPRFSSIKHGKSLTCGCSAGLISGPNIEIQKHIESQGFNAELEFKLAGYKYDICVKNCKTLIEFQGTRYHNSHEAKQRDKKKKNLAEVYGYALLQIEESVWRNNKKQENERIINTLLSRKNIGYDHLCKNEILAQIEELSKFRQLDLPQPLSDYVELRHDQLIRNIKTANEDIMSAAISSHHVMCSIKNMDPGDAFGNDPFVYYGLGLVGEAGELTGALLRVIRNGGSHEDKRMAVEEELADCMIYAIVLAYATGIDIVKKVNEKAKVVIDRAKSGYYGGPLKK